MPIPTIRCPGYVIDHVRLREEGGAGCRIPERASYLMNPTRHLPPHDHRAAMLVMRGGRVCTRRATSGSHDTGEDLSEWNRGSADLGSFASSATPFNVKK
ncbi:MAG: hypothetical protein LAO51_01515 [Acidobacteriia bacterium]|nr:hypothetical protein [Terriglobia bacterium]